MSKKGTLNFLKQLAYKYAVSKDSDVLKDLVIESTAELEKLVKKATPMKPTTNYFYYYCAKCKFKISDYGVETEYKCCPRCSQAIDWSEE